MPRYRDIFGANIIAVDLKTPEPAQKPRLADRRPFCPCGLRSVKRCTHELGGDKAGQTCRAPLCQKCAYPHGKGLAPGVCPAHAPKAEAWDPVLRPIRTS